jgi:hypothetical protein
MKESGAAEVGGVVRAIRAEEVASRGRHRHRHARVQEFNKEGTCSREVRQQC